MKSNVEMAEVILSNYYHHLKMRASYGKAYAKAMEEAKIDRAVFSEKQEARHARASISLQLLMDDLEIEYVGYRAYIANLKNK